MSRPILIGALLVLPLLLCGQTNITHDLEERIASTISGLPGEGSDEYSRASVSQRASWDTLIQQVINANYSGAATRADDFDYTLYYLTDTGQTPSVNYYLLEKDTLGSNY